MRQRMTPPHLIGVISDTHGLVRPQAAKALQGSELIIHAGDVGKPEILDELRKVARVVAVRGNVDHGEWAQRLKRTETVEISRAQIYVIHNLEELSLDPVVAGYTVVISGRSHKPSITHKNGVLFL